MASRHRYTAQQVIDALHATRGLVYLAAQRLGCDPDTIMNYCKRYPTVEQAKHDARGALLDMAEAKLFLAVQRDEAWAITFCLKTIGRSRGYGERLDLEAVRKLMSNKSIPYKFLKVWQETDCPVSPFLALPRI